jgi:transposase
MAMSTIAEFPTPVTVGVDTHSDTHTAVVLDALGVKVATGQFCAAGAGYVELEAWAKGFGPIDRFGIEGTGSWGAGLTRHLQDAGHEVIEVDQPDRKMRRRLGKSDPADAEAAARSVLAGTATTIPKDHTGNVESIRVLHVTRKSAVKARSEAKTQLKSLISTAPDTLRGQLRDLTDAKRIKTCAAFRLSKTTDIISIHKTSLRSLARRINELSAEIAALDAQLKTLVTATAPPALLKARGVGINVAAQLLITAGQNAERVTTAAKFTRLVGTSPIPASSGNTERHRLNRGGDRQANAAIHRIAITRIRCDERTQAFIAKCIKRGKTRRSAIRILKNYIAREVYKTLTTPRIDT